MIAGKLTPQDLEVNFFLPEYVYADASVMSFLAGKAMEYVAWNTSRGEAYFRHLRPAIFRPLLSVTHETVGIRHATASLLTFGRRKRRRRRGRFIEDGTVPQNSVAWLPSLFPRLSRDFGAG
jgi:hypothetical protein